MFGLHGVNVHQLVKVFKRGNHFPTKFLNKFAPAENHVQNCQTGSRGLNVRRGVEWENGSEEDSVLNQTSYQTIAKRTIANVSIVKHVMSVHAPMLTQKIAAMQFRSVLDINRH